MPPKKDPKKVVSEEGELEMDENAPLMKILRHFEHSCDNLLKHITANFEKLVDKLIEKTEQCFNVKLDKQGNDIFNNAKKCEELENENKQLHKDLEKIKQRVGIIEQNQEKCKDELDEVESYSRRDCLIFSNVKPITDKTDEEAFIQMCEDFFPDLDVSSNWIDKLHRLKPKPDTAGAQSLPTASKPDDC